MINSISYQQCVCNICGKLTQTWGNLWKSVINDVLITQINIRLRSIRVLIVVNKGKVIRCFKCHLGSDLGEQFITLSPISQHASITFSSITVLLT